MRIDCEQGTAGWFEARCGRVTSSRVADAMSFLKKASKNGEKGMESQARKNLKAAIVAEQLTRIHQESYVSDAMKFGTEQEPFARALYEVTHGVSVSTVGFFVHPKIDLAGASPDGLIEKDGLLEIKCPNTTTHLNYVLSGEIPEEYQFQMLWQMACTGRQWCDFVSYDPRMPDYLQLWVKRFPRNNEAIGIMEQMVRQFLSEVEEMLAKLPKPSREDPEELAAISKELDELWITKAEARA